MALSLCCVHIINWFAFTQSNLETWEVIGTSYCNFKNGQKQSPGGILLKNGFLEISQNLRENTCVGVSFLIKSHFLQKNMDGEVNKRSECFRIENQLS